MHQSSEENPWRPDDGRGAVRVLIADDEPRGRQSLKALLTALHWNTPGRIETPIDIVGDADSGQHTVEQVQSLLPDVVLMDFPSHNHTHEVGASTPHLDGPATIRTIKSRWPDVRVVVLTLYATERSASLLAGADAFLLKGCPTSELLAAVMPAAP